jgi:gamma-glutamyltranspeptidase/glutathione hydrolase
MSAHAFNSRRSTVHSSRGLVSCSQPLAASAGIAVLNAGGNAADAAVAVAAALNVTEPNCTGIGGDAFCLFWDAREKRVRGINGSGRAPEAMTLQRLQQAGLKEGIIPLESVHSVTVPGAPACWDDTVRLFGARAHGDKDGPTLAQVLAPAIRLADNGYPVCAVASGDWVRSEALIKRASPNWAEMMHSSGKAPREGEFMRMPNLARTFRELASKGKAGFYEGRIAGEIVKVCGDLGGLMTLDDLKHHGEVGSNEITPISYLYKGAAGQKDPSKAVRLHECPPNGQGLVALEALSILDELQASGAVPDLLSLEHNSPEYLHALIVALRLGFADAGKYVADPDFEGAKHVEAILSPAYAKERAKVFDAKTFKPVEHGNPRNSSDTVYFSVVDQEGNACSFINSNCECSSEPHLSHALMLLL